MAMKHSLRHFVNDINGRDLRIYTDHKPIIGSWKTPELQIHDPKALNAINEISQWTSDIRYKPGKELLVPDLLSRPFGMLPSTDFFPTPSSASSPTTSSSSSSSSTPKSSSEASSTDPEYVSPSATLAALESVAVSLVSPKALSEVQKGCPEVARHKAGQKRGTLPSSGSKTISNQFC